MKIALLTLCAFVLLPFMTFSQQWLGSTSAYSKIYRADKIKVGYGPLYLDWTYQNNWGGNAQQWAGYVGFNAFRNNDDIKDKYYGENPYTSKLVFEGSNAGFRWLHRAPVGNDSDGQHTLSELMVLRSDGRLGIGTINPDAKLAVKGTVHANEVKVDLSVPGPDYVFADNYQLQPLNELKSYIDQNKHLPEVPSAAAMEANGINLGEMNMLLLKKVEELTLYVIELKKENEKTASENAQIKTEIIDIKKSIKAYEK